MTETDLVCYGDSVGGRHPGMRVEVREDEHGEPYFSCPSCGFLLKTYLGREVGEFVEP